MTDIAIASGVVGYFGLGAFLWYRCECALESEKKKNARLQETNDAYQDIIEQQGVTIAEEQSNNRLAWNLIGSLSAELADNGRACLDATLDMIEAGVYGKPMVASMPDIAGFDAEEFELYGEGLN
jgi:hypothetical protein